MKNLIQEQGLFSTTLSNPHLSDTHKLHGLKPVGIDLQVRLTGTVIHQHKMDMPDEYQPQSQGAGGTHKFVLDPAQLLKDMSRPLGS